jgi:hypothetical protein
MWKKSVYLGKEWKFVLLKKQKLWIYTWKRDELVVVFFQNWQRICANENERPICILYIQHYSNGKRVPPHSPSKYALTVHTQHHTIQNEICSGSHMSNYLDLMHTQSAEWKKKIWCASRARVNLPHVVNRKCFQFVLQLNLINETEGSTFLSRNFSGRYF